MGTMAKFYKDEEAGNYHLLLRPYDPETYAENGQPLGGPETITEVVWTEEEFQAACGVIDQHRQTEQSSNSSAIAPDGA